MDWEDAEACSEEEEAVEAATASIIGKVSAAFELYSDDPDGAFHGAAPIPKSTTRPRLWQCVSDVLAKPRNNGGPFNSNTKHHSIATLVGRTDSFE